MDDLTNLISEISKQYPAGIPATSLETYCRRYLHFYHRHVQPQPVRFYGAWGWSEARRQEFLLVKKFTLRLAHHFDRTCKRHLSRSSLHKPLPDFA